MTAATSDLDVRLADAERQLLHAQATLTQMQLHQQLSALTPDVACPSDAQIDQAQQQVNTHLERVVALRVERHAPLSDDREMSTIDRSYQIDEADAKRAVQHLIFHWGVDGGCLTDAVNAWIEQAPVSWEQPGS